MRNLRKMDIKQVLLVFFVALTIGIVVFGTPPDSQAQVTISNVKVTIGPTSYTLWGSQAINAGQSLVLAQDPPTAATPAFNFDSSDSNGYTGGTAVVSGTGSGFGNFSFTDTTHVLTAANADPTGFAFNEAQDYTQIGSFTSNGLLITVSVGYADNAHSDACGSGATAHGLNGSTTCFPSNGPFAGANFFQGSGQLAPSGYPAGTGPHAPCSASNASCYDSGVILFSASLAPSNNCPLTQGFWKNHFPGSWPSSVIANGLKIGSKTYTAQRLEDNLETPPKGGNALVILSHQLITAKLNILNGSNPAPIAATITAADAAIDGLDINNDFVAAGSSLGQLMTALSDTLDSYNSSNLTPTCTGPK